MEQFVSLFSNPISDEDGITTTNGSGSSTKNNYDQNKPVILNKCSPASDGENPFGSTFCYGTDQLIVEVRLFLFYNRATSNLF